MKHSPIVNVKTGVLSESVTLPPVRSLGKMKSHVFTYNSSAANPSAVVRATFDHRSNVVLPTRMVATLVIGQEYREVAYTPRNDIVSEHHFFWNAMSSAGGKVPSGTHPYRSRMTWVFLVGSGGTGGGSGGGSGSGSGSGALEIEVVTEAETIGRILVNNRERSPFGAGWDLEELSGLFANPDGSALMVDGTGNLVHFDAGLTVSRKAGRIDQSGFGGDEGLATQALIEGPKGLARLPLGDVAFSDSRNQRIRIVDLAGSIHTVAGDGTAGYTGDGGPGVLATFNNPTHLAADQNGTIYVLDQNGTVVRSINSAGTVDTAVDGGTFVMPSGPPGTPSGSFGMVFSGLAVSPAGDIYVTRRDSSDVWKVPAGGGQPVQVAGATPTFNIDTDGGPAVGTRLNTPGALAYDATNRALYIMEEATDQIRRVDGSSLINIVAGVGSRDAAFLENSLATSSGLQYIAGTQISLDEDGALYFVAAERNTIRKVTKGRILTTAAGKPGSSTFFDDSGDQEAGAISLLPSSSGLITAVGHGASGELLYGVEGLTPGLYSFIGQTSGSSSGAKIFRSPPGHFGTLRGTADGKTRHRTNSGVVTVFDAEGRHESTIDTNNNLTTYTYDSDGLLIKITDPGTRETTLAYVDGKLATVTDAAGRVTRFVINTSGDLTSVQLPNADTQRFTYTDHLLATKTDAAGGVTQIDYGPDQMVRSILEPDSGRTHLIPGDSLHLTNSLSDADGRASVQANLITTDAYEDVFTDQLEHTTRYRTSPMEVPTRVQDPLGRVTQSTLDANEKPQRVIRPDGSAIDMSWCGCGSLLSRSEIVPAVGLGLQNQTPTIISTLIDYEPVFNRPVRVRDSRNGVTLMQYDSGGNLSLLLDPDSKTMTQTFDPRGLMLTHRNRRGKLYEFSYNTLGNLVSIKDPAGGTRTTEYDLAGNITGVVDTRNHATRFEYDALGRMTHRIDALGGTRTWIHGPESRLLEMRDERGNRTMYTYDARNRRTGQIDAVGHAKAWEWDLVGNLTAVVDEDGRRTEYRYDAANRLIREIRPASGVALTAYDVLDNVVQTTDPEGRTRRMLWNSRSQQVGEVDGNGQLVQEFVYSNFGDLALTVDGRGKRTTTIRDILGRPTSIVESHPIEGLNRSTAQAWDANSNLIEVIDPSGTRTAVQYDDLDRPVDILQAAGTAVERHLALGYDSESNRTSLTNGAGAVWSFVYNDLNLLSEERDPESPPNVTHYFYDATRNLSRRVDAKSQETTWDYDQLNRWSSRTFVGGQETQSYTATGQKKRTSDGSGAIERTYDLEDRLETYTLSPINRTITMGRDLSGRRKSLQVNANPAQIYSWDANGRLAAIVSPTSGHATFAYDVMGGLTSKGLPNDVTLARTLDGFGRVKRMLYTHPTSGTLEDLRNSLDSRDNIVLQQSLEGMSIFSYNSLSELTLAVHPDGTEEQFSLDSAGNIASKLFLHGFYEDRISYSLTPGNRLIAETTERKYRTSVSPCPPTTPNCIPPPIQQPAPQAYVSDANGNLTSITSAGLTTSFVWNGKDQLTKVDFPDGRFQLNAYWPGSPLRRLAVDQSGTATAMGWDLESVNNLEDINAGGATTASYLTAGGMDSLIARTAGGVTHAYLGDQLGSVRKLIDSAGAVASATTYLSYGTPRTQQGAAGDRMGFTGRETDAATGLVQLRHRWLDPRIGRFVSQDPIGFAGGINQFAYVGDNPVNFSDPLGLSASPWPDDETPPPPIKVYPPELLFPECEVFRDRCLKEAYATSMTLTLVGGVSACVLRQPWPVVGGTAALFGAASLFSGVAGCNNRANECWKKKSNGEPWSPPPNLR